MSCWSQGLACCEDVVLFTSLFFVRVLSIYDTIQIFKSHDILLVLANLDVLKFANIPKVSNRVALMVEIHLFRIRSASLS